MKITLIELNEFNQELLESCSSLYKLPHLKRLVSMYVSKTKTDDTYESDFLEPWVQWVSVHTGVPSSEHGIKHLGDVPKLGTPQLWKTLSDHGLSSIIWGAMNSSREGAEKNQVFMPDPWTASEMAYPEELNFLLNPLRAVSTNYLKPDKKKIIKMLKDLWALFKEKNLVPMLLKQIPAFLKELVYFKGAHFVFIAFVEYVGASLCLKYKKDLKSDFCLLFLNTLAHLQHHHWKGFDYKNNKKLQLGLTYLDKIMGKVFASLDEGEVLIVTNALSQKNTNDETPWILYRPYDHKAFLNAVGIYPTEIKEHMTHDAHLYFENKQQCQIAKDLLEAAKIENKPLFLVESYQDEPLKLFYRLQFTDKISENACIHVQHKILPFYNFYQSIVERTGKHIPSGTCYCSSDIFPELMYNHELNRKILNLFNIKNIELLI
jgi:hypothetical protein